MYFTFDCPHCQKKLKVREEAAGRKAGCPYCRASVIVPSPPSEPEPPGQNLLESFKGIGETQQTDKVAGKARRHQTSHPAKHKSAGSLADRTDVGIVRSCL